MINSNLTLKLIHIYKQGILLFGLVPISGITEANTEWVMTEGSADGCKILVDGVVCGMTDPEDTVCGIFTDDADCGMIVADGVACEMTDADDFAAGMAEEKPDLMAAARGFAGGMMADGEILDADAVGVGIMDGIWDHDGILNKLKGIAEAFKGFFSNSWEKNHQTTYIILIIIKYTDTQNPL